MKLGRTVKNLIKSGIVATGYTIKHLRGTYNHDGLWSIHNHDFLEDPAFLAALHRGETASPMVPTISWRLHVALWCAHSASKLDGDFVECGVAKGFMSSAIMTYLDWNSLGKKFYLLDTFQCLDKRFEGVYAESAANVRNNFAGWPSAIIIEGFIPETLPQVASAMIAYLHLDMNNAAPEIAAINHFWDRLVPGAFVLLDDYAYVGFEAQKAAMDSWASREGVTILSLPTGQGLLVKPR